MNRHKVVIEIMIEGTSKDNAIYKAQQLCNLINEKDKHCKAWVKQMIVNSKEKTKDTSTPDVDKF